MKASYVYYLGAGLAAGALLAHLTRPKAQVSSGAITGPKNPCNTLIEADRLDRGASSPSKEMLLTYQDAGDPAVIEACADQLAKRAKQQGKKVPEEMANLRAGVASWYDRSQSSAMGGPARGSITFGA